MLTRAFQFTHAVELFLSWATLFTPRELHIARRRLASVGYLVSETGHLESATWWARDGR